MSQADQDRLDRQTRPARHFADHQRHVVDETQFVVEVGRRVAGEEVIHGKANSDEAATQHICQWRLSKVGLAARRLEDARRQSAVQPCAVVTETQAEHRRPRRQLSIEQRARVGEKRTMRWASEKTLCSGASAIHSIAQPFHEEPLYEEHRAQERSDDKIDCAER
jgi:hypothetical protein